jgi:hypothetical protein
MEFKLLEFRQIKKTDPYDNSRYCHWSRYWEYPLINSLLHKFVEKGAKVHNTSWGFEPPNHTDFKEDLENYYGIENVTNSDIKKSDYPNTCVWDITTSPPIEWHEYFDAVINVSTLEEVPGNHFSFFKNLYLQVKRGGLLIITFDLPGFQLDKFEQKFQSFFKYEPDYIYSNDLGLHVGVLCIKKIT